MNVAILGAEPASQGVAYVIENGCNVLRKRQHAEPLHVVAYITLGVGGSFIKGDKAVLNFVQFAALYHKKIIDKIIFPREVYVQEKHAVIPLLSFGINIKDILIAQRLSDELSLPSFLEPYIAAKYLPYFEFIINDHCNLNCAACDDYCGLVKEPYFANLERFTRDFERMHEKFIDDIGQVRIMGGEPLLNPEVSEYVKLSRRLYPQADIRVVTNALLLQKMPEDFFETLRRCNARIDISVYPPLESKMPAITHLLEEKNVQFTLTFKKTFDKTQTLTPHNHPKEMFLRCGLRASCPNLYEGKIAACWLPFMTKYFNAYYGKNLPEDGALDLYDKTLTTEKLKAHLLMPFERCRYCTPPVKVEWRTIKKPSPITDWVHE